MASITLQPYQDAYISEWYANQNFGSNSALFVSQYKQPKDDYRSLLHFDLSSIPSSSTIEKAELLLCMYRNEVITDIYVNVHRLLNNWNQYTVTWSSAPSFSSMIDGSLFVSGATPLGPHSIDVTDLVKGWYDGSIPNNGMMLVGNEMNNDLVAFRSTNYMSSNAWPMLSIKFVEGILESYEVQKITIPDCPPDYPIIESSPIILGPREKATFLIWNTSHSPCVKAMVQVGFDNRPDAVFFDAGPWNKLEPQGFPGEAVALSTTDAAELARVLICGEGGETIFVFPRTREE